MPHHGVRMGLLLACNAVASDRKLNAIHALTIRCLLGCYPILEILYVYVKQIPVLGQEFPHFKRSVCPVCI